MSQMGMQMPGGHQARRVQPDIYTGLMLFSFIALAAATVFVVLAGERVGPSGNPLALQDPDGVELSD